MHPQTQGKIERYHRSMKNAIKLENYYSPDQLRKALAEWVHYYNHLRYHESIGNVTPADMYYGKQQRILKMRQMLKRKTIQQRRKLYLRNKSLIE